MRAPNSRHCEERSDEAISGAGASGGRLLRFARNDAAGLIALAATPSLAVSPALAQIPTPATKIDGADTAWMIVATGIVLMMTLPGLALFYAGMVRKKNVLATAAWCGIATFVLLRLVALVFPLRASTEDEVVGLDISLHGESLQ